MNLNLLVVCYKPSSDDYCRGCHMASYPSEHYIRECETEQGLISFVAGLNSRNFDCNEVVFDYTVFRFSTDDGEFVECTYDFNDRIREETKRLITIRECEENAAEVARKEKEAEAKRAAEIEQLKKLKEKYG